MQEQYGGFSFQTFNGHQVINYQESELKSNGVDESSCIQYLTTNNNAGFYKVSIPAVNTTHVHDVSRNEEDNNAVICDGPCPITPVLSSFPTSRRHLNRPILPNNGIFKNALGEFAGLITLLKSVPTDVTSSAMHSAQLSYDKHTLALCTISSATERNSSTRRPIGIFWQTVSAKRYRWAVVWGFVMALQNPQKAICIIITPAAATDQRFVTTDTILFTCSCNYSIVIQHNVTNSETCTHLQILLALPILVQELVDMFQLVRSNDYFFHPIASSTAPKVVCKLSITEPYRRIRGAQSVLQCYIFSTVKKQCSSHLFILLDMVLNVFLVGALDYGGVFVHTKRLST